MYLAAVILLMLVLPAASVAIEALRTPGAADLMALIGKWFTFWAVGARLFIAGVMQSLRPQFTAQAIFDIKDQGALAMVREIGFSNLTMGALGLASLIRPEWVVQRRSPAAFIMGLLGSDICSARTGTSKSGRRAFPISRFSSCLPS